ncbi:hypothetical protein GCK72_007047 [Caenorhabditis remanei]|uniref:Uncharacterized protein n=1 Tax=Caenorhabditis remanei TaxID=31234 RepID=A0A6A5HI56_CAERE|nr:hypothetical protein GCK72_007047 [Caenorhabditis remanei]KAF1767089.1 hypothetical protein GCK72_007047 [Caenorhabditis remanei]
MEYLLSRMSTLPWIMTAEQFVQYTEKLLEENESAKKADSAPSSQSNAASFGAVNPLIFNFPSSVGLPQSSTTSLPGVPVNSPIPASLPIVPLNLPVAAALPSLPTPPVNYSFLLEAMEYCNTRPVYLDQKIKDFGCLFNQLKPEIPQHVSKPRNPPSLFVDWYVTAGKGDCHDAVHKWRKGKRDQHGILHAEWTLRYKMLQVEQDDQVKLGYIIVSK